jgi:hypothetical protein
MSHPTTTSTANTMPRIAGTESCADTPSPEPEPTVGVVFPFPVVVGKTLNEMLLWVTVEDEE